MNQYQRVLRIFAAFLITALGFVASSAAHAQASVSLIYNFQSWANGIYPTPTIAVAPDGTLYGATSYEGTFYRGTVFKVSPDGVYTVLRQITESDGGRPRSVTLAASGDLYVSMSDGSAIQKLTRITPAGALSIVAALPPSASPLTELEPGVFYGTSYSGGNLGFGSVFKVTATGVVTQLYSFSGADGGMPLGGVIRGPGGHLYGTTKNGGSTYGNVNVNYGLGVGTVFKLEANGVLTTLLSFVGSNGMYPDAGLTTNGSTHLFGVTRNGGDADFGTVFKISATGEFTRLHSFPGFDQLGAYPQTTPLWTRGFIYGTTFSGGTDSTGIAFRLKDDGTGYEMISDLIVSEVSHPGPLVLSADNVLYGVGSDQGIHGNGSLYQMVDPVLPAKNVDLSIGGSAGQTDDGIVTSSFVITNRSRGAAVNVLMTTTLPAGASLIGGVSSTECTQAGSVVSCLRSSIYGNNTGTFDLAFQLSTPQPNLTFTAAVSAQQPETAPADNVVSVTTVRVIPAVDLLVSGSAIQNSAGRVTTNLVVSNAGTSIATGIAVAFTVPQGTTLASGTSGVCSLTGTTVRCLVGAMGASSSSTLQIFLQLTSARTTLTLDTVVSAHQTDVAAENNATTIDAGYASFDYKYDGNGALSHRYVNGGTATHVFYTKGGLLLGEYANNGALQRENIYLGKDLVAYENAGTSSDPACPSSGPTVRFFVSTDPLSSPVAGTDACGNVKWKQHYAPFGDRLNSPAYGENDQWFAGEFQESKTRLVNMGARQYSPVHGRFLSIDPLAVNPSNSFSFNRYAYANNNPYRYVDPNGESPLEIAFLIADTVELVSAIRRGEGVGLAALNVAVDIIGVACPVPGLSAASHSLQAVSKVAKGAELINKVDNVGDLSKAAINNSHGIIYKRTNPLTGETYIGQAKSSKRFEARQKEHDAGHGIKHDYETIGTAPPGKSLDVLEETMIRTSGGIQKEGGTLLNKRHQMSDKNYRKHGGTAPK